jgi:hypothetical protein
VEIVLSHVSWKRLRCRVRLRSSIMIGAIAVAPVTIVVQPGPYFSVTAMIAFGTPVQPAPDRCNDTSAGTRRLQRTGMGTIFQTLLAICYYCPSKHLTPVTSLVTQPYHSAFLKQGAQTTVWLYSYCHNKALPAFSIGWSALLNWQLNRAHASRRNNERWRI